MRFVGRIVLLTSAVVGQVGCSMNPQPTRPPARSQAVLDAVRLSRSKDEVSNADSTFLMGDLFGAQTAYERAMKDPDKGVRLLAKRKLASVYEVRGHDKQALDLLQQVVAEKQNIEPLTSLKILYLAERLKDQRLFDSTLAEAVNGQAKAFEIIHDPLIAPGKPSSVYYWLGAEALAVSDINLSSWALDRAAKVGGLTDQQWLQIASATEPIDSTRSLAILKRIETNLSGEDKIREAAILNRINSNGTKNSFSKVVDVDQIPYVIEFRLSGYWITGKSPKFQIIKMRAARSR